MTKRDKKEEKIIAGEDKEGIKENAFMLRGTVQKLIKPNRTMKHAH